MSYLATLLSQKSLSQKTFSQTTDAAVKLNSWTLTCEPAIPSSYQHQIPSLGRRIFVGDTEGLSMACTTRNGEKLRVSVVGDGVGVYEPLTKPNWSWKIVSTLNTPYGTYRGGHVQCSPFIAGLSAGVFVSGNGVCLGLGRELNTLAAKLNSSTIEVSPYETY